MSFLSRLIGKSKPTALAGGYEASRLGRRLNGWHAERRNINALLKQGGEELRARARQLCRENPYAANACEAFVSASVGTGIKPSSLSGDPEVKREIQVAWLRWTDEADADGLTDFYGQQALAARAMFEAGECFIRFRSRRPEDGLFVPLQLQVLESEHLPFSHNETLRNGNEVRAGIEFDKIGRRVAYHFLRTHPGEGTLNYFGQDRTVVPAAEVMHLYRPLRPGQIRGQPGITPGMIRLYLLDQYDDAELDRKRVAAMFAGFITKPRADGDLPIGTEAISGAQSQPTGTEVAPLEPGAIQVLLEGEDIKFSEPSEVGGSYEAFQYRSLLAIAAAVGLPYHALTSDVAKANYSSLRASQVESRRRMDQFQHATLVFQLCRPVWRRWLETAILSGAVSAKVARAYRANNAQLSTAKWIPPKWDWVDPLKDRQAQALAEDRGWIARSDSIDAEGYDAEEVDARILSDQKRERDMGIQLPPHQPVAAGAAPASIEDDENKPRRVEAA